MNKRVLMIAYLYPPISNSGTQRPFKFSKHLSSFGWSPTVVTAENTAVHPNDANLLAQIPPDVSVVRVPMLNELVGSFTSKLLGERIGDALSWRLREPFRRPDLYALWRPTARRAALRIFRQQGFDAIYATGYPWTSLLVGADVARATGRPLLADFRDPWAADDMATAGRLAYDDELAMERSVVRQAARVVSVSDTMTRMMRDLHAKTPAGKFVTIHNGFDPADFAGVTAEPHTKFRIVYTGVWKDGYGPVALYDAIEAIGAESPTLLQGVEVIAAGFEPGEARRRSIDAYITELGRVSHQSALSLMRSADVLFLPNANGSRQALGLPGKMFEYLAAARPVLAFMDPDGDAGRLLQAAGGNELVNPADPGALLETLKRICTTRRMETRRYDRDVLVPFERMSLTRKLAATLDDIVAE